MAKKFLDLKTTLSALDQRKKDHYDRMDDEDKKLFSPFMIQRYMSSVSSDQFFTEHHVEMVNETTNKNHWVLSKDHKGLLWKLLAMCGTWKNHFHQWIAGPKKEKNTAIKVLMNLYPNAKIDELELLSQLMSKKELKQLLEDHGETEHKI